MKTIQSNQKGFAAVLELFVVAAVVAVIGFGVYRFYHSRNQNQVATSSGSSAVLSAMASPYSWGFIGCSNTHDTVWGYHNASASHLFWPAAFGNDGDSSNPTHFNYNIEGQTVYRWSRASDAHWSLFDQMKQLYNGGQSPALIWIQLCENLNKSYSNYHVTTEAELSSMLKILRQHAPSAAFYISPLQTYDKNQDGTWICPVMNGKAPDPTDAIAHLTSLANKAVDKGLALAGPGTKGVTNLGPLTLANTDTDHCHPTGNPKHQPQSTNSGSTFLGGQLGGFFDQL